MPSRTRAEAVDPDGAVGSLRYSLYVKANERISDAIEAGYYLEAICLIESFVSDRLESRLSYLSGRNRGFQTLGRLIQDARKLEDDDVILDELLPLLNKWREGRNEAAHELVKIESTGGSAPWEQRMDRCRVVATGGHALMKRLAFRINELRDDSQSGG